MAVDLMLCPIVRRGQGNGERAATPGLGVHADCPAVRIHDKLNDAQTQPAAFCRASQTSICLIIPIEDAFDRSAGHPNAIVRHGDEDLVALGVGSNVYVLVCSGVFPGVVK